MLDSASEDGPPHIIGAVAQLGERLVRNQKVAGSIPASSTIPACSHSKVAG